MKPISILNVLKKKMPEMLRAGSRFAAATRPDSACHVSLAAAGNQAG
jgi:hypothetical protein